jgi:L-fucose isomerase-like protein
MNIMKKLMPHIGVAALSSPMEVGAGRAARAASDLVRILKQNGCEVVTLGSIDTPDAAAAAGRKLAEVHVDAVALTPASWFEDYLVLDLLEECDVPVLLWPLPGMETGALCGAQQATTCLKQLAKPGATVFGPVEDGAALDRALVFLKAAALFRRMRRARIGLAGQRVRGMMEVAVNEFAMKRTVGPRVVPVDMVGLIASARAMLPGAKQKIWKQVKSAAGSVKVAEGAGQLAAGMTLAIREIVEQEGLAGLAFGCYPDFMGYACLAASLLADDGIPVGCEGDVNGVAGMLMLGLLTGQPVHNTDLLDPLPDGSVVFTHCGSGSYALAANRKDISLAPVRLAKQGVCSLFPAKPGPVTLVNLIPSGDGYQLAVMEGEALPVEMVFPGNPLRVKFQQSATELIEWIHSEGIGHHWMAGYGHVAAELADWAKIAGPGLRMISAGV